MKRFILFSFAFLGLAFYELSGGSDFDPVTARNDAVLARSGVDLTAEPSADQSGDTVQLAQADAVPEVTRVSLNLTALGDVLERESAPARTTEPLPTPEPNAASVTSVTFSRDNDVVLPSLIFPGTTARASSDAVGAAADPRDLRSVTADRVNMRGGPGTAFDVVTQLDRNTKVEVLQDDGSGWVRLRPLDGGPEGWIADFLLTRG
ncbi:SH3 domain-containing protein [Roseobacter sinensis]|uniref:SH3 domain-containing protein n=1 Tax=Roseobacter sinensis TaxID=2931391 RepID=A0ABT3BDG6_9RHOB|nr:SH3 domain-containing protein [Roseobacter sp. WL0113]MCV3271595.1 SH3 domain-containing protein [Roseobacter sp. WL0113]